LMFVTPQRAARFCGGHPQRINRYRHELGSWKVTVVLEL